MSAVSEVRAAVYVGGEYVPCSELRVVMDEGWAPYVQAEAVVPYTPERAALLDPHAVPAPRVVFEVARHWHGSLTAADLSVLYAGLTAADLSVELAGLTAADLTDLFGTPWESGWRQPDVLTADLAIRGRRVDHGAATITLRGASDELLLQDARAVLTRPVEPLPQRLAALVEAAGLTVGPFDFSGGAIFTDVPAVSTTWTQSLWDVAESTCRALGMRLWCDHQRTWQLTDVDTPVVSDVQVRNASAVEDDSDRDGDYADVLVWHGKGINGDGLPLEETRTYPDPVPPGPHRVHYHDEDYGQVGAGLPMPDAEELRRRLAMLSWSARTARFVAPADPMMRPGPVVILDQAPLPVLMGHASRMEWAVPDDTVTITTRNVLES